MTKYKIMRDGVLFDRENNRQTAINLAKNGCHVWGGRWQVLQKGLEKYHLIHETSKAVVSL